MTPEVTVVTSVYNGGEKLFRSLESVLKQEGIDLEYIVVDDGSTDESPQILADLERQDPRLRVLRQENQGLTRALIRGCAEARGEFIARHDSDDCSLPGRLAQQVARLRDDTSLSFVSCWAEARGPEDELLYVIDRPADPVAATDLLLNRWQGPPHHGTVMMRTSCYHRVGGYRPEFYFSQDSDLWLRLSEVGRIAYEQQVLYAFRISEESISSMNRPIQHQLGLLSHACRDVRLAGRSEVELLQAVSRLRPGMTASPAPDPLAGAYFIGRCLVKRRDPRACIYLRKVLKRRPWRIGAWFGLLCSYATSRPSASLIGHPPEVIP